MNEEERASKSGTSRRRIFDATVRASGDRSILRSRFVRLRSEKLWADMATLRSANMLMEHRRNVVDQQNLENIAQMIAEMDMPQQEDERRWTQVQEQQQQKAASPLKYGCDDVWTWNRKEKSSEVRLFGTNCRIALFHPHWSSGTAGVRGTRVLNNGKYYWELRLSQRIFGTSMMFGIGTRKVRLHADTFTNLLGEDANGWGLSHKGVIWHSGTWHYYTKPFRENEPTVIGMLFDGIAGTLTYYKDGKCLGVAFRGLNEVKEPLYPIICSTAAKTEMALLSMKRDFVNLQDRCRAVIVKSVKRRKDVEKLMLPSRMKVYITEAIHDQMLHPLQQVNMNVSNSKLKI